MTQATQDRLYNLLPALHRLRDSGQGEPLRALLTVMEEGLGLVEADIDRLYENWFIETCDEWVVPYLADLLGVRGLQANSLSGLSRRTAVANTFGYRRRKGTGAVLEQLSHDLTGWGAKAVELFANVSTTQHLNHLRPGAYQSPDLRRSDRLELLGGPFDSACYTADLRSIQLGGRRVNIPNVALFLWRLQAYPLSNRARVLGAGRFTFSPLGWDGPLFQYPVAEAEISHLATEANLPGPLRRRPLYDELEARRRALAAGNTPSTEFFGPQPSFAILPQGGADPIPPEQILICDLSDWATPSLEQVVDGPDGPVTRYLVAVDPVLGRLVLPAAIDTPAPIVRYAYGFPGDLGGGPYDREESVGGLLKAGATWQMGVAKNAAAYADSRIVATISDALVTWNAQPPGTVGIITVMDSGTYVEDLQIEIKDGSQLLLVAATWPLVTGERLVGQFLAAGPRPHLAGNVDVEGSAVQGSQGLDGLFLNGLLVEGGVHVLDGNLGRLDLSHVTLVPGPGGFIEVAGGNQRLALSLQRSIMGTLSVLTPHGQAEQRLTLTDSLLQKVSMPEAAAQIEGVTIFGATQVRSLMASNAIFGDAVTVQLKQEGCVRFCYVAPGSTVPRRYHCQPDPAVSPVVVQPIFTSDAYGEPAFGQLSQLAPPAIRTGAEDQGEMGAWHFVQVAGREANLRANVGEYLRAGLAVGLYYVT